MTKASRPQGRFGVALVLVPLGALAVLGAGALVAAWLDRNALGARVAIDYLARRGVPASVHLTRLDRGGVEGSLVLGPPDHPTLSVPRFLAEFSPAPLFGVPQLRDVVLVHPRLELGYDGRRLDLGALRPLVEGARPQRGGRLPDIAVRDGEVRLRTVYGPMTAALNAEVAGGALRTADVDLRPLDLRLPAGDVRRLAVRVRVRPAFAAHRYLVQAELGAVAASGRAGSVRDVAVSLQCEAPYDPAAASPWAGTVQAHLQGTVAALDAGGGHASRLRMEGALAGTTSGRPDAPTFDGHATMAAQGEAAAFGDTTLAGLTADGRATQLGLGPGRRGSARFALAIGARSGRSRVGGEPVDLSALRLTAAGSELGGAAGPSLEATANLSARGGMERGRAGVEAARLVPWASAGDLRAAVAAALGDVTVSAPQVGLAGGPRAWRMRLAQPLQARTASGARLDWSGLRAEGGQGRSPVVRQDGVVTLAGGGFPALHLAVLDGEGGADGVRARLQGGVAGSGGPLRDGRLDFAAGVQAGSAGARVVLERCASAALGAWRAAGPTPLVRTASVTVCPDPAGPLLAVRGGAWRAAADVSALDLAAPTAQLSVSASGVSLQAAGHGRAVDGRVSLGKAVMRDAATPVRFAPLVVSGPVSLADRRIAGALDVSTLQSARPLGRARLSDDLNAGEGGLRFDAPHLVFAPGGLQPASVLPGLAGLGQDVSGPATVALDVTWRGATVSSSARIGLDGVQVRTAAGVASGVRTTLVLTDLAPLVSAPDQRLTADRIAAVLPLTDVSATYALGGDALALGAAQASVADGRVWLAPMRVGLTPGAPLAGVVHIDGVRLGKVLDAFNLARAVTIQARIAGALPFDFGPKGLWIADGRFAALGPGRISLNRRALSTVASGDSGAPASSGMQDFAYQALEDLAVSELDARVASRPGGRLGVLFHIRGRHDPPVAKPARIGLFALLRGHAFDRPIPLPKGTEVNLTLDSSLNLDDLLAAYLHRPSAGSAKVQP